MAMTMMRAPGFRVGIVAPNYLEAKQKIRKDPYPIVCGECGQGHMNDYQFRPHGGAGLICATGHEVDGGARENMHYRSP
jgi:hypothetical protein